MSSIYQRGCSRDRDEVAPVSHVDALTLLVDEMAGQHYSVECVAHGDGLAIGKK
jgi:hypothetical protein